MVNAVEQYRTTLKKELRCNGSAKARLLSSFDKLLATYLEEHPNPSLNDLVSAFGPQKEMAAELMLQLTPQEQTQHQKHRLVIQFLGWVLVSLLVLSTLYIWFFKNVGLTSIDRLGIDEHTTEPTTFID